ncbi:MAG TPA: NepR family anti-sigma factor [Rhizomicrobium sp.]
MSKDQNPNREKARAIRARQRVIGRELRRIYDAVAHEPIPDEFMDLLQKLDAQEEPGKKSS